MVGSGRESLEGGKGVKGRENGEGRYQSREQTWVKHVWWYTCNVEVCVVVAARRRVSDGGSGRREQEPHLVSRQTGEAGDVTHLTNTYTFKGRVKCIPSDTLHQSNDSV